MLEIVGQPGVIIQGSSPALILERGHLVVRDGVTFVNATDAPTILVLGGVLTLRDTIVHESTGFAQAAIQVLGGSVDLQGNTLIVHGDGQFIENLSPAAMITTGNEYQTESATLYVPADVVVFGTPGDDNLDFLPGNNAGEINIDASGVPRETLMPTGRLVAFGGDGNDTIQASSSLSIPAWFYGEKGNDRLRGAEGSDVLLGGPGDDLLAGHAGRDYLAGGLGADRLVGNADDDIVIAGCPSFDASAVEGIMSLWSGTGEANARRLAILDYMSVNALVVTDDTDRDLLTGSAGIDWFFANLQGGGVLDKVTDFDDTAFATDLAFILA